MKGTAQRKITFIFLSAVLRTLSCSAGFGCLHFHGGVSRKAFLHVKCRLGFTGEKGGLPGTVAVTIADKANDMTCLFLSGGR